MSNIKKASADEIIRLLRRSPGSRPADLVLHFTCAPLSTSAGVTIMKDYLRILYELDQVDRRRDHKRRYVYYAKNKA